jgi:hypothetical protein
MSKVCDTELNEVGTHRRIDSRNTARRLQLTQRRVRQLAVDGALRAYRDPGRKLWFFDPTDVDAYNIEMVRRQQEEA